MASAPPVVVPLWMPEEGEPFDLCERCKYGERLRIVNAPAHERIPANSHPAQLWDAVLTMRTASFTLSIPPSVNGLYTTTQEGKRVKTKAGRQWAGKARDDIRLQAIEQRMQPFDGQFRIAIWASDAGLTHARDCDNLAKATVDAFVKAGLIPADDHRHMRGVSVDWDSTLAEGVCAVTVTELAQEPTQPRKAKSAEDGRAVQNGRPGEDTASVMAALEAKGIKVAAHRVHIQ